MTKAMKQPGSIYAKDGRIYFRLKVEGKWKGIPSPFKVGQEKQARAALIEVKANQAAGIVVAAGMPVTCSAWAAHWIEKRKKKVASWKEDERVLRKWMLPAIGSMRVDEVRTAHLLTIVEAMQEKLASRSVHTGYSTIRAFFRDACKKDIIGSSPCLLDKYDLGEKEDKDPDWRMTAQFKRAELEALISDERIPLDRRVMYALKGVAGLRHSEAAGLNWKRCGLPAEPVDMLWIHGKNGINRPVPIHPTLATILAEWRLYGWRQFMGRPFTEEDLVLPIGPARKKNGGSKRRPDEAPRTKKEAQLRFLEDLETLGFRRRRGHDLRRTMISLSRTDGAEKDIHRRATHKPPKEVYEGYTTFEYDIVCREVLKLKISRRGTGQKVIALPVAANESRGLRPSVSGFATPLATPSTQGVELTMETTVGPPGFEPGENRLQRSESTSIRIDSTRNPDSYKQLDSGETVSKRQSERAGRSKVANGGVFLSREDAAFVRFVLEMGRLEAGDPDAFAAALKMLDEGEQ